jgi:hypothetical protein
MLAHGALVIGMQLSQFWELSSFWQVNINLLPRLSLQPHRRVCQGYVLPIQKVTIESDTHLPKMDHAVSENRPNVHIVQIF